MPLPKRTLISLWRQVAQLRQFGVTKTAEFQQRLQSAAADGIGSQVLNSFPKSYPPQLPLWWGSFDISMTS